MSRVLAVLGALALAVAGFVWWANRKVDPPVETIVASSLQSLNEQNRLSVFAARFVTAVTSRKAQFGLSAEKTLIIPAMVRYEIDLAGISQRDLAWDEGTRTLTVRLPPVEISGPEFDLEQTREYTSGMVLMALTDVEQLLDSENLEKAGADIVSQARSETTMKLARDAGVRAVANSFAMPLRAAGIEASVQVEFKR